MPYSEAKRIHVKESSTIVENREFQDCVPQIKPVAEAKEPIKPVIVPEGTKKKTAPAQGPDPMLKVQHQSEGGAPVPNLKVKMPPPESPKKRDPTKLHPEDEETPKPKTPATGKKPASKKKEKEEKKEKAEAPAADPAPKKDEAAAKDSEGDDQEDSDLRHIIGDAKTRDQAEKFAEK